jgi:hypothetical protein
MVDRMSARRQRERDSNCSDYYADLGHGLELSQRTRQDVKRRHGSHLA